MKLSLLLLFVIGTTLVSTASINSGKKGIRIIFSTVAIDDGKSPDFVLNVNNLRGCFNMWWFIHVCDLNPTHLDRRMDQRVSVPEEFEQDGLELSYHQLT